jgi:indolepyruvate ferredoxin oxidoreductase alpha subunit
MTGHQPNPASEEIDSIQESPPVDLEALIEALGVKQIRVVNPQHITETVAALKDLKDQTGIRVLIARQPCIVNIFKRKNEIPKTKKYQVNQDLCTQCAICIDDYACPAFELDDKKKIQVNEVLCIGCGDCVQVCPVHAIGVK